MFSKRTLIAAFFLSCLHFFPVEAFSWGFWAHQRLNRLAVFTLPPEMLGFYKSHLEFLTEHAVDPDKRRYAVDGEAQRHFIDLDHYGTFPFADLPRSWRTACDSLSEDTLQAYGILPYHLPRVLYRLTEAFREGDLNRILKNSADLGHYLGDAHVPLHSTENYNGQLTGQRGIHGFWESRLPELFAEEYNFFVGPAYYIEDPQHEAWEAIFESHRALDSVLSFEQILNDSFPPDKKYGYETRNNLVVRTYSRTYAQAYHEMLDGMVERRMRQSIRRIGAFWYTAWVNAGSPDLSSLTGKIPLFHHEKPKKRLKIIDREADAVGALLIAPHNLHTPE